MFSKVPGRRKARAWWRCPHQAKPSGSLTASLGNRADVGGIVPVSETRVKEDPDGWHRSSGQCWWNSQVWYIYFKGMRARTWLTC